MRNETRRARFEQDNLYEHIGEGRDPDILANALEAADMVDKLMETSVFWLRRIALAKELVKQVNEYWGAYLSARLKIDYLLSDRDLNAMRIDFSFDLVNNKPRHKVRSNSSSNSHTSTHTLPLTNPPSHRCCWSTLRSLGIRRSVSSSPSPSPHVWVGGSSWSGSRRTCSGSPSARSTATLRSATSRHLIPALSLASTYTLLHALTVPGTGLPSVAAAVACVKQICLASCFTCLLAPHVQNRAAMPGYW